MKNLFDIKIAPDNKKFVKFIGFVFVIVSFLSLFLFISFTRNILISLVEQILGRAIEHQKWHSRIIRLEFWFFVLSLFIGMAINSEKIQKVLKDEICLPFKNFISNINFDSNSQKSFSILFLLYIIGFSSIIRANFFYADDFRRNAFGVRSWDRYGRYIDDVLSPVVHGSKYLCDVGPLTHILSALILAYSSFLVIKLLKTDENKKINFLNLFAVLPLGINPYFLENISYRFDAPYMSLSILVSILPFVFFNYSLVLFSLVSIIGILLTDMTYQASSGVYPIMAMLICWKLWNKNEKFYKFLLTSIFSYLAGMLIFKIFIMSPSPEAYNSNKIMLSQLIPNFKKYYGFVASDFRKLWFVFIAVMFVCFMIFTTINSKKGKLKSFFVSLLIIVLSFIMAFGLYPVLELPLFAPHAMYGFCVMLSFFTLYSTFQRKNYLGILCTLSLSWCFFSLFFVYGNVMVEQNRYENFRISQIINDLNDIEEFSNEEKKVVQIKGTMGYSPRVKPIVKQFKCLDRTILKFTGGNIISEMYFRDYFNIRNLDWDYENGIHDFTSLYDADLSVIKDTMYHTIKGLDSNFLIELK